MIISHAHKYLFVELPRTGSTAIHRELRDNYDGSPILFKHATYQDFLRVATEEEKTYFVFSCIRNPLDDAVSLYYKYRTNHKSRFTSEKNAKKNGWIAGYIMRKRFTSVHEEGLDFPAFFMKYYRIPYNNWSSLAHRSFDFIIRFENMQGDFATVLRLIGLERKRPLPVVNKTSQRGRDYREYYTLETIARARRVFGPYMKQWGYEFPAEWGPTTVPWWNQAEFKFFNFFRMFYWKYLRGRDLNVRRSRVS